MFHRRRYGGSRKRPQLLGSHSSIFLVCAMLMFWTLAEGMTSFIIPLRIEEEGFSDTMMGIIIGSSSVAGALFDLIACRFFSNTFYKRIYGLMFILCLILPAIIFQASSMFLFLVGMMIWGIYYDLRNIGNFDYVARTTKREDNAHVFGLLQMFQSVGWILGPLIVGFLVGESVGWQPFVAIYIFLGIALAFFLGLYMMAGKRESGDYVRSEKVCRRGTWSEVRMMGRVGRIVLPSLLVIFFLNFTDAFFWSIGPLFAEEMGLGPWAGLFVTAWSLPALLIGWYVGTIINRYGKERTAYVGQFVSTLLLIPLLFIATPLAVVCFVFVGGFFAAVAWPSIQAAFADYIEERPDLEKEIEGLEDLYTNLGFVLGPITAGILADAFGYNAAFGMLGIGVALFAALMLITRRNAIRLGKDAPPLICDV